MATGNVIVNVVDVGQGQSTFVEIYNTSGKLINTLLFDCGSDKTSDETQANLDYIAAKALELDTPGFSCIFFSHSDKDHISLTRYVLDKIALTTAPVIDHIYYGGVWKNYTKSSFNILNYIWNKGWCSDMKNLKADYTDYDASSGAYTDFLWKLSDNSVIVRGVAANVLSDDPDWDDDEDVPTGKTAEELNRVSMVCGLYYGTSCFVICGDATNKTMAAIGGYYTGTTVFNNNKMLTLPHHGSRATGLAVTRSQQASSNAVKVVKNFAAVMKGKVITVSAYAKHRHPSLELMNYFIPTVGFPILQDPRLDGIDVHFITAQVDVTLVVKPGGSKSNWNVNNGFDWSFEAATNTFSTRYCMGDNNYFAYNLGDKNGEEFAGTKKTINGFASWKFTVQKSSGTAGVTGYVNLGESTHFTEKSTLLSAADIDEAEAQPLPAALPAAREFIVPVKPRKAAAPVPVHPRLKQFH